MFNSTLFWPSAESEKAKPDRLDSHTLTFSTSCWSIRSGAETTFRPFFFLKVPGCVGLEHLQLLGQVQKLHTVTIEQSAGRDQRHFKCRHSWLFNSAQRQQAGGKTEFVFASENIFFLSQVHLASSPSKKSTLLVYKNSVSAQHH